MSYFWESAKFKGYTEIRLGNRTSYIRTKELPRLKSALARTLNEATPVGYKTNFSKRKGADIKKENDFISFLFEGEMNHPDYPYDTGRLEIGDVTYDYAQAFLDELNGKPPRRTSFQDFSNRLNTIVQTTPESNDHASNPIVAEPEQAELKLEKERLDRQELEQKKRELDIKERELKLREAELGRREAEAQYDDTLMNYDPLITGKSRRWGLPDEPSPLEGRLSELEKELGREKSSRTAAENKLRDEVEKQNKPKIVADTQLGRVTINDQTYERTDKYTSSARLVVYDEGETYRALATNDMGRRQWETILPKKKTTVTQGGHG